MAGSLTHSLDRLDVSLASRSPTPPGAPDKHRTIHRPGSVGRPHCPMGQANNSVVSLEDHEYLATISARLWAPCPVRHHATEKGAPTRTHAQMYSCTHTHTHTHTHGEGVREKGDGECMGGCGWVGVGMWLLKKCLRFGPPVRSPYRNSGGDAAHGIRLERDSSVYEVALGEV